MRCCSEFKSLNVWVIRHNSESESTITSNSPNRLRSIPGLFRTVPTHVHQQCKAVIPHHYLQPSKDCFNLSLHSGGFPRGIYNVNSYFHLITPSNTIFPSCVLSQVYPLCCLYASISLRHSSTISCRK